MANVSVPKLLFGLIYLAIPGFLLLCPDVVSPYLTEEWMFSAIIGGMAFFGLLFIASQKRLPITIITFILMAAALALAMYNHWDEYIKRFDEVKSQYTAAKGTYYDVSTTPFQAQINQIPDLAYLTVADIAKFEWIAMFIPILILGLMGVKDVIAFAAIPKSKNSNTYNDRDIPENLEAMTNRPTAEQRAAKLEATKSGNSSSASASSQTQAQTSSIQNGMAPDDQPLVQPISPSFRTTAPKSGVIMPSWESGGVGAEPVIKVNNKPTEDKVIDNPFSMPGVNETQAAKQAEAANTQFNNQQQFNSAPQFNTQQQFNATPQFNAQQQFNSAPQFNAQQQFNATPQFNAQQQFNATPQFDAQQQFNSAPQFDAQQQFNSAPQFNTQQQFNSAPTYEAPQGATIPSPFGNPFAAKPAPAAEPAPAPAPKADTIPSPFGNPFAAQPAPAAEPAPAPAPKADTIPSPFGNPFATQPAPAAEPAPAPVAEPATSKVVLPTATISAPQTRSQAQTTKLATRDQISDDDKARIKDLQQKVSELKTLYNQGMITQDEYITQRTNLLQQMYSK